MCCCSTAVVVVLVYLPTHEIDVAAAVELRTVVCMLLLLQVAELETVDVIVVATGVISSRKFQSRQMRNVACTTRKLSTE